eukprot:scaffold50_cov420-Prasinococcus_capsulatus_cf.AAC.30
MMIPDAAGCAASCAFDQSSWAVGHLYGTPPRGSPILTSGMLFCRRCARNTRNMNGETTAARAATSLDTVYLCSRCRSIAPGLECCVRN